MYNNYINNKISEKIEYDKNFLKEYLLIYLHLLISFFCETDRRIQLTKFVKNYFRYSFKEYELLNLIKKLNNENLNDTCIDILEELEKVFLKNYEIIDLIMRGYEEAIYYKDINASLFSPKEFNTLYLDENIKKIKKGMIVWVGK